MTYGQCFAYTVCMLYGISKPGMLWLILAVLTLSYWKKTTSQLLLIGLFHNLISVQDVVHDMLHLHVAQQLPSLKFHAPASYLSYSWQWSWALNRHFPLGIFRNKILSDLLKLSTKAEKSDGRSKGRVWHSKLYSWLMFSYMKKVKNRKNFTPIACVLFLRLTCDKTLTQMFFCLYKNIIITLLLIQKPTN